MDVYLDVVRIVEKKACTVRQLTRRALGLTFGEATRFYE